MNLPETIFLLEFKPFKNLFVMEDKRFTFYICIIDKYIYLKFKICVVLGEYLV